MPFHDVRGVYPARKCIVCGKTFIPKTANHWCCSVECSKAHARNMENAREAERKKKKKTITDPMAEIRAIAKRGVDYGKIVVELARKGEL